MEIIRKTILKKMFWGVQFFLIFSFAIKKIGGGQKMFSGEGQFIFLSKIVFLREPTSSTTLSEKKGWLGQLIKKWVQRCL